MNLSSIMKIGVGAMTGGVGGAAMGAASSGNSPLSKAAGLYSTGKSMFGGGSGPTGDAPMGDGQSQIGNDYNMDPNGAMGAMQRKSSLLGNKYGSGWGG